MNPETIILDGRALSKKINSYIKSEIESLSLNEQQQQPSLKPGLCVVIVGDREDSKTYVSMKSKKCKEIGIESKIIQLSENTTTENLLGIINIFNNDKTVNGILVQLPLPQHINQEQVLSSIKLEKDVDGFHCNNMGNLAMENRTPLFVPCTPKGCIRLLDEYNIDVKGKKVVVIGKSNIVGLPISLMLMNRNATVTVCHKYTGKDTLKEYLINADIIISGCGQPRMITGDWVKQGVIIIDIGINHVKDDNTIAKTRIVGDVDYDSVFDKASYITPVPGGIGPMTISMLMENTFNSFKNQNQIQNPHQ